MDMTMDELIEWVSNRKNLRADIDYEINEAENLIIEHMRKQSQKTMRRGKYKVRLREDVMVRYDEDGIRKALGARLWNKVTKKVLDKPKLEMVIGSGDIDYNIIAQHSALVPKKAFITINQIEDEDAEGEVT